MKELPEVFSLVDESDNMLNQPVPRFDFNDPEYDPIAVANLLAEQMIKHKGLGLSANQLGLPVRAFAMATNPVVVCFNPVLVDVTEDTIMLDEGCLSYPGIFVNIERPVGIKVRYTLPNGHTDTYKYNGMTARIWLHEFDHMEGKNFIDRAKPMAKKMAMKKWKKKGELNKRMQRMRVGFGGMK